MSDRIGSPEPRIVLHSGSINCSVNANLSRRQIPWKTCDHLERDGRSDKYSCCDHLGPQRCSFKRSGKKTEGDGDQAW